MSDVRLIDANALKEDLKNMLARVIHESDLDFDHSHAKIWTATKTGIQHSIKRLDNAPTIDVVEVVHGRWEKVHGMMPPEYHHRHVCSVCCSWALQDYFGRERFSLFCPNCGAKMDAKVTNVPTKDGEMR